MVKHIQWRYYVLAALYSGGANATSALLMIFLLSRGLDERGAMLAYACYFLALALVEIPTGAGADVGGRKRAFVIACGINAVGMMTYAFAESFFAFALAASVVGVGTALAGGTLDSWLVAQMKRQPEGEEAIPETFFRTAILKCVVAAAAGFVGIVYAGESMMVTWVAASVIFAGTGLLAHCVMREADFDEKPRLSNRETCAALRKTAQDAIAYWRANANVRFIVVAVAALYCSMVIPNMLWQPHFLQWLPDKSYLGYVWAGAQAANALGALVAMRIAQYGRESGRKALLICHVVVAVGIIGSAMGGNIAASLLWYFVYQAGRGAFEPINRAYLHRSIDSEGVRTTVASIEAIGHHLGSALGLVIGAQVVYSLSREMALILAGALLLAYTLSRLTKNGKG